MNCGACQVLIISSNGDFLPVLFGASIVDISQVVTVLERAPFNAGDAGWDTYAGQAGASTVRCKPNVGDTGGDDHAGQALAVLERLASNARDAGGDDHAGQALAVIERLASNAGDTGWNAHTDQVGMYSIQCW